MNETLFITHKYPPSIGGMQKQSYELISGCERRNEIHKIIYDNRESKFLFFFRLEQAVKQKIKENPKIGLIHVNDGLMAFLCPWLINIKSVKKVCTIHGLDIIFNNSIYRARLVRILRSYDAVIAVSRYTATRASNLGIRSESIHVINNGVDEELYERNISLQRIEQLETQFKIPFSTKNVIVAVGRAVKRKGFSCFVDKVFRGLGEDFHMVVIGPLEFGKSLFYKMLPSKYKAKIDILNGNPTDGEVLKRISDCDSIKPRISLLSSLDYEDLLDIVQASGLFVMPNIAVVGDMEGFGLVALEASLLGTMVMTSGIEGIADAIYNNRNGYVLDSMDTNTWINRITDHFSNFSSKDKVPARFRLYSRDHFSWKKMVNEYILLFEKLMKD